MIKLIAADMDGTLLDSQKHLPESFPRVMETLREKGIVFAPASGRQYYNLRERFHGLADELTYISENGAMIGEGAQVIYMDELPRAEVAQVVDVVRRIPDTHAILSSREAALYQDEEPVFVENMREYYARTQKVDDLRQAALDYPVCKIAVFLHNHAETVSYPALRQAFGDRLQVVLSGKDWVDIMNPGVSKGQAIRWLQQTRGISFEQTAAFGDYLNDLDMMGEAYYAYAMANGHEKLKQASRFIAPSNDENGVMRTIHNLLDE